MTVRDVICEFCDTQLYPDMNQEVKFAYGDLVFDGLAGANVPKKGPAVVKLSPAERPRRFAFALRFESRQEIEAETIEEAEEKARRLLDLVVVKDRNTDMVSSDYEAEVPCFLQEVKE